MDRSLARTIAPIIRGLTRTTRFGLHVYAMEGGEERNSAGVAELRVDITGGISAESVAGGFAKSQTAGATDRSFPGSIRVPGVGLFGLGSEIDEARRHAEAAARAETVAPVTVSETVNEVADADAYTALAEARGAVIRGAVVAVTGGAQGFGEEIVRHLAAGGATVFVVDLNEEGAKRLSDELNTAHGRTVAIPVSANVTDEDSVQRMVETFIDEAGGIDLYISNAGVLKAGSVKELSKRDFEFVTSVNYTGYFLGTKHVAPVMARQHEADPGYFSDIIQINSKSGLEGSNKNGAYAGGKFGGIGLTQSFALELITDGVKVNSVCPGNFFDGPLWSDPDRGLFVQYLDAGKVPGATTVEEVKAFYEAKVPMKRGCTGADVMKAIYYIVEQTYETGQAVPVTGGQVMLK